MAKNPNAHPSYPDAHPTAPGGMSQAALRLELAEKHGIKMDQTRDVKWPVLIEWVIEQRRLREQEKAGIYVGGPDKITELIVEVSDQSDTETLSMPAGIDEAAALQQSYAEATRDDLATMLAELEGEADGEVEVVEDPIRMGAFKVQIEPVDLLAEELHDDTPSMLISDPDTYDYVFNGHAGAGPSASERWLNCTESLRMSREFLETLDPNQMVEWARSNIAARQGTTAHAAAEAEALLVLGRAEQAEVDITLMELSINPDDGEQYDEEMGEYITEYVDLIKSYADERGAENILIEERVSAWIPLTGEHEGETYEVRGSTDCSVLPTQADPTLVVTDLKYGNGIDVEVDENSQARIYALGVLDTLVDDEGALTVPVGDIVYHIVQPRLGGIKTWSETLDDLLDWRDEVLSPGLTQALYGGGGFNPSETACQWCPARGRCAALAEQRLTSAAELFNVIVEAEYADGPGAFPETGTLANDRLGSLLAQIEGLTKIKDDIKSEVQRRLLRGEEVPGYQLVNYTPPRTWNDEAVTYLKDEADLWTEPQLLSPTQALATIQKMRGKDSPLLSVIEQHIIHHDKKPVVAREGDRRKPWTGKPVEDMFANEDGDERAVIES